jgi:hypothetical protein
MLRQNPLQPPRPVAPTPQQAHVRASTAGSDRVLSAEDFDTTGILAGVDPSESRYWWMPELYGPPAETLVDAVRGGRLSHPS